MPRVLCAWEFGGDLGHVRRLIPIARELRAAGHEIFVAFRDSAYLELARREGFDTFIAPLLRAPTLVNPAPVNFSDVLLHLGFDDVFGVRGAIDAWRGLYSMLGVDLVVADYAPTAILAARLAGLRRATVGGGFALPAPGEPLPAMRSWLAADVNVLRALDDRLLARVRSASRGVERTPQRIRELFEADLDVVTTFAELDPFGPREGVVYVGPTRDDAAAAGQATWLGEGPRVFAYLKPRDERFTHILAAIAGLGAEAIVAAPGLAEPDAKRLSTGGVRVMPHPVTLAHVLGNASLCVSHGGAGLTAHALAAGVPLALVPQHLEQFLVAQRVDKIGAGVVTPPDSAQPNWNRWLAAALGNERIRAGARAFGEAHRGHETANPVREAATRIAALLEG